MKYFAFISYAREDKAIAHWLHEKLEKYPYPQNMVSEENRPLHKKLVRKIFIDVKDLSVSENEFTDEIKASLEQTRYLIVICSKHSVHSKYVEQEISYFLKTHENKSALVLPVFVDEVDKNLPSVLSDLDVLKRNCPIYNSKLPEKSEANLYCFYHIAAFLLKVDFVKLYDRYESYSRRKKMNERRVIFSFVVMLLFSAVLLYLSLNRQRKLTRNQAELTLFEKSIFPLSVVFGYEENFLSPVINYLKKYDPTAGIYVLMPYSIEDFEHQDRISKVGERIKAELQADSIYSVRLPTNMKRGTIIGRIAVKDLDCDRIYVDFASTTSTFLKILEYKLQQYPDMDGNEVIRDYTDTFIRQTNEQLQADSSYVHFYISKDDFVRAIRDAAVPL